MQLQQVHDLCDACSADTNHASDLGSGHAIVYERLELIGEHQRVLPSVMAFLPVYRPCGHDTVLIRFDGGNAHTDGNGLALVSQMDGESVDGTGNGALSSWTGEPNRIIKVLYRQRKPEMTGLGLSWFSTRLTNRVDTSANHPRSISLLSTFIPAVTTSSSEERSQAFSANLIAT